MSVNSRSKLFNSAMIIALVFILGGGFSAYLVQTGCGSVEVRDVRFMGSTVTQMNPAAPELKTPKHIQMSGLLYIPKGASAKNKAPGILAIHGYYNSREAQDAFGIEFSRRGYVVLAVDQTGHGYSDAPAFANAFGGIDSLAYLRSLDFVDTDNIGIEGHSMGGWAIAIAAAVIPNGYKSFLCMSSTVGLAPFGVPAGSPTYPKNFALVFSLYDEFSGFFWEVPKPSLVVNGAKLKKIFDTTETVQIGKLYGSIEKGTARKLYMPAVIHPMTTWTNESIANGIEWMQSTLKGGKNLDPSDQIWRWKEIFTFIALIGMVILVIALGGYLLNTEYFKELKEEPETSKSISGVSWWIGAILMVIIPLPIYYYLWSYHHLAPGSFTSERFIWPQQITNIVMFWAIFVAIISLILFLLWHYLSNKKKGATASDYGLTWKEGGLKWNKIGKSALLAFIVIFIAHFSVALSGWLFDTDYRLWVLGFKPLDAMHFGVTLGYIIPFTFYFLILGTVLHGQMRPANVDSPSGFWKEVITNIVLLIIGYILFLLIQYVPIFAGGELALPEFNLGGIFMFQLIGVFTILGIILTYFYRKTGHIYVGAFMSSIFVTWIFVASQVIHYIY